jgi:hypothetical protein
VKHRSVQAVHRPVEALYFIDPEGRWKDYCCKECTESRTQITRGYLKDCHKECEHKSSSRLRFISESLGGLVPLKSSKEDRERNYYAKVKFSGRTPNQFGQRSH